MKDARLERWNEFTVCDGKGRNRPWTLSKVEWVREAQLDGTPGNCALCGQPISVGLTGRLPMICKRAACLLEYHREARRESSSRRLKR